MKNLKLNRITTLKFIGNDVVSLTSYHNITSFRNERYLEKILNQNELDFYRQSQYKSIIPPLFWSCKESAYKILLQMGVKNSFSPRLFHVDLMINKSHPSNHFTFAEVLCHYKKQTFFCASSIENNYIHTCASLEKETLARINAQAIRMQELNNESQSETTYKLLMQEIAAFYSLKESDLQIKKDIDGAPSLYLNNLLLNIPFSISHDENCMAFAFVKQQNL